MKTTTPKERRVLNIGKPQRLDRCIIVQCPVILRGDDDKLCNGINNEETSDLMLHISIWDDERGIADIGYYNTYCVDVKRAPIMAKSLLRWQRKRDRLDSSLSYAQTPYESAARWCAVLGIEEIVEQTYNGGFSYSDSEYRSYTIASGIARLQAIVNEFRDVNHIKAQSA